MSRKFLHAADIHLDSPLQKLDAYDEAPVEQIRMASRRALENLVDLALHEKVDLVVIAGDLYDGDWPDQNTGLFFVSQASRLVRAGIPVAVIRGNHDAANRMTSSLPLPKNPDGSSILFSEKQTDLRRFEKLGIAVHGRSYRQRAEIEDLTTEYPAPLAGMFNLGLLHTSLSGFEGHDRYAPCTSSQLTDKGYDYWALGHVHVRGEHQRDGEVPIVFSGNVQGRHVGESGAKGCVLVEIDDRDQCYMTFRPLDVLRFETCTLDATSVQHEDEWFDHYERWLTNHLPSVGDRLLVTRVQLQGQTSRHAQWVRRLEAIESGLRAVAIDRGAGQVWLEGLKVRSTPPPRASASAIGKVDSLAGAEASPASDGPMASIQAVVDQMLASITDDEAAELLIDDELRPLLRKLPDELTQGTDVVIQATREAVQQWINDAAAELAGRLQPSDSKGLS